VQNSINKYNGSSTPILDLLCADDTASVDVRLKGTDIQGLAEGDIIAIRNGRIMIVNGHIRLEIDRWGKVTKEVSIWVRLLGKHQD